MPELVNRRVSSCGIRLDDATGVWPRWAKKSMKAARSSSAVRGGDEARDTVQIVPATYDRLSGGSPGSRRVTASKSPTSFPDTGPSFGRAPARLLRRRGSSSRVSSDGPYRRDPSSSSSTPRVVLDGCVFRADLHASPSRAALGAVGGELARGKEKKREKRRRAPRSGLFL